MYDMLLPNASGWSTADNVMQHIFPTTPVELGPGFIIGKERIVTKASRTFGFPAAHDGSERLCVSIFDRQGWLTNSSVVEGPQVAVALGGGARSFAVVVRCSSSLM